LAIAGTDLKIRKIDKKLKNNFEVKKLNGNIQFFSPQRRVFSNLSVAVTFFVTFLGGSQKSKPK